MKKIQILFFIVLAIFYVLIIYTLWYGLSPEKEFHDYYSDFNSLFAFTVVLTPFIVFVSFVLGWDPREKFLNAIRNKYIIPLLTSVKGIVISVIVLSFATAFQLYILYSINENKYKTLLDYVIKEDFDSSSKLLSDLKEDSYYSLLVKFNDAAIEKSRTASNAQNDKLCGKFIQEFLQISDNFKSIEFRFFKHLSLANCYLSRKEMKKGLEELELCAVLSSKLSKERFNSINHRVGLIYMLDSDGQLISDKVQRLNKAYEYLSNSSSSASLRMMGNIKFLLTDYSEAIRLWNESIEESDSLENKKIYNNIALANMKMEQLKKALVNIERALAIRIDTSKEDQRKEHIRNLSNKCEILVHLNQYREAHLVFLEKEKLQKQETSSCGCLIESSIYAGLLIEMPNSMQLEKDELLNNLIYRLLRGTEGCTNCEFFDSNSNAINSLIDNAEKKFNSECYSGLAYNAKIIKESLTNVELNRVPQKLMEANYGIQK